MPNSEGEEPADATASHTMREAGALVSLGVVLAVFEVLRVLCIKKSFKRLTPQMKNVIAMTFSWCLLFGTDWALSCSLFHTETGMMKQVTLALAVTALALLMIFLLENIEDSKHLDKHVDRAIRAILSAI